jgi:hypothetical protein
MTRVRAYTVAEVGRALGMISVEVHKAIERSLLRAFTINKAIRVPANRARAGKRSPRPSSRNRKSTSHGPRLAPTIENEGSPHLDV